MVPEQYLVCPDCGPRVRLYSELWGKISESPLVIELIEQGEHGLRVLMEVPIKQMEEEEVTRIIHCGNCGVLVHSNPVNTDPVTRVELYLRAICIGQEGN